jgi:hypothetical protein
LALPLSIPGPASGQDWRSYVSVVSIAAQAGDLGRRPEGRNAVLRGKHKGQFDPIVVAALEAVLAPTAEPRAVAG